MRILVTGSAGHLGEALVRTLRNAGNDVFGMDILSSPFTTYVANIAHRDQVRECIKGVHVVLHAATLHKPHVSTHSKQTFTDIEDVVNAHVLAIEKAPVIGFGRYIISATTPFAPGDLPVLRSNAAAVVKRYFPDYEHEYARRNWKMFPSIDRVYVNSRARTDLSWNPKYDFRFVLERLKAGEDPRSLLARAVGAKGYHS
jgi:nucleoside-diphosphate-sugar epimerase